MLARSTDPGGPRGGRALIAHSVALAELDIAHPAAASLAADPALQETDRFLYRSCFEGIRAEILTPAGWAALAEGTLCGALEIAGRARKTVALTASARGIITDTDGMHEDR